MKSLLADVSKIEQDSGLSPELAKASDDLLQMVAAVLIAQAIPDLLKEGDISSVKGIFSELNASKIKIMADYQESVKPYYEEIKKILAKNEVTLRLADILPSNLKLDSIEGRELDNIIGKLKIRENMTGRRVNMRNPIKLGRINRYPASASFSELFNFVN